MAKTENESSLTMKEDLTDFFLILFKPKKIIEKRANKKPDFLNSLIIILISSGIFSLSSLLAGNMAYNLVHTMFTSYLLEMLTSGTLFGFYLPATNVVLTILSLIIFWMKMWLFGAFIYWGLLKIFKQDVSFASASEILAYTVAPISILLLAVSGVTAIINIFIPVYFIYLLPIPTLVLALAPTYQMYFNKERDVSIKASLWAFFLHLFILAGIYLLNHPAIFYMDIF